MKTNILSSILGIIGLVLASCSTSTQVVYKPYLDKVTSTGCLDGSRDDGKPESQAALTLVYDNETLHGALEGMYYSCDFGRVHMDVTVDEGQITIVEYPENDMADCRCPANCEFVVKDFPEGTYQVKVFAGNTEGKYNANAPYVNQTVTLKEGSKVTLDIANNRN